MFRPGDGFIAGDKASESRVVMIAFINLVRRDGAQRGAWGSAHRTITDSDYGARSSTAR